MPQGIGSQVVDTPLKAQISRHYQKLGGDEARGAASATAREFKLGGRGAAARVKRYDKQIEAGNASRANRRSSGRPSDFNEGKGRGGSKRVHTDTSYAWLREKLKISDS